MNYKNTCRVIDGSCILFAVILFAFAFSGGCTRSNAAPRPAQVFALADGCADSAGTFFPAISDHLNLSSVVAGKSHFIRVCNEVYVEGKISWAAVPVAGSGAVLTFEVPIPTTPDPGGTYGVFTWSQVGIGGVPLTSSFAGNSLGFIQVQFTPSRTTAGSLIYSYTYTIQ